MRIVYYSLIFVAGLLFQQVVFAQRDGESNDIVARIAYVQDVSEITNQDLNEALKELRERTKQLQLEIEGADTLALPPELPSQGSGAKPDISSTDQLLDKKIKELNKTFSLLQRLIAENRRRQIESAMASKKEPELDVSGSSTKMKLPDVNADGSIAGMGSGTKMNDGSQEPNGAAMMKSLAMPRQVVSKIIDPFELGNSLFMQGSFEEAMKFYKLVPEDQLSSFDHDWLQLMKATCHKAIGESDAAEALYREVVNSKYSSRPSTIAKGWLQFLATKKSIDQLFEENEKKANLAIAKADKLIEELNEYQAK